MKQLLARTFCAALVAGSVIVAGCGGGGDSTQVPPPAPAAAGNTNFPSSYVLAVPYDQQQTLVWCWAASEQMVLAGYGRGYSQTDIVSFTYGAPILQGGTATQIQGGIYYLSGGTVAPQIVYGALTYDQVRASISGGKPIIVQYESPYLDEGHFVVIYRYTADGKLLISDPIFGQFTVPYGTSFVYGAPTGPLLWFLSIVI